MKKQFLLFLLLFSFLGFSQTPTGTTSAGKFKAYTATKDNTATRVVVQDSITKEYRWVLKSSLAGVNSVTGTTVDNTDPANPIVNVPTLQEVTSVLLDVDGYAETTDGIKTIDLKAGGFGAGDLYYGFGYSDVNDGFNDLYYIPLLGLTHNSQVFPKTAYFAYDGIATRDTSTKKGTSIISDGLNFEDSNTGKYILLKSPTSIVGTDKVIQWRDLGGTPALLSDIPSAITIDATPTNGSPNAVSSDGTFDALATKVDKNTAITGATKTKITYDSKGLVTAGTDLSASDLPTGIDAAKINTGVVSNTEFNYLDGVNAPIQAQLDLRKKQVYSTGTSVTHTGSTSETQLVRITIPAGTLTTTDWLNINRIVIARGLGQISSVEIKLKLSTSATLPSGTTDQIGTCTFSNTQRSNMIARGLWQESGNINFFNPTTTTLTDIISINGAFGSAAFNNTSTTYYLYISATLVTGTDNVILRAVDITN